MADEDTTVVEEAPTEITLEKLGQLLSTAEVAEMFDVSPGVVRREAKKGNIPGKFDVLGKVGFDPDLVTGWKPPEGRGSRVSAREDGRQRYEVMLLKAEFDDLLGRGFEVSNPREAAKKRRAARRAAKKAQTSETPKAETPAGETKPGEDLFANFKA